MKYNAVQCKPMQFNAMWAQWWQEADERQCQRGRHVAWTWIQRQIIIQYYACSLWFGYYMVLCGIVNVSLSFNIHWRFGHKPSNLVSAQGSYHLLCYAYCLLPIAQPELMETSSARPSRLVFGFLSQIFWFVEVCQSYVSWRLPNSHSVPSHLIKSWLCSIKTNSQASKPG